MLDRFLNLLMCGGKYMLCSYAGKILSLEITLITSQHQFTRWLETGCVPFLHFYGLIERLLFATLSLTLSKNFTLFKSTPPNVFLAPYRSQQATQAANMGPSCKLRQPIRTYMYCFVLSKGSVNDIIIITIGFIH